MLVKLDDDTLREINNLRGKYIKQILSRLEITKSLTPETRKVILDGFNDLYRELHKILEYEDTPI